MMGVTSLTEALSNFFAEGLEKVQNTPYELLNFTIQLICFCFTIINGLTFLFALVRLEFIARMFHQNRVILILSMIFFLTIWTSDLIGMSQSWIYYSMQGAGFYIALCASEACSYLSIHTFKKKNRSNKNECVLIILVFLSLLLFANIFYYNKILYAETSSTYMIPIVSVFIVLLFLATFIRQSSSLIGCIIVIFMSLLSLSIRYWKLHLQVTNSAMRALSLPLETIPVCLFGYDSSSRQISNLKKNETSSKIMQECLFAVSMNFINYVQLRGMTIQIGYMLLVAATITTLRSNRS